MTTTFFRFKKSAKRILKSLFPYWLYASIIAFYRTIAFSLPSRLKKAYTRAIFREKKYIWIPSGKFHILVDPDNGHTDLMLYRDKARDKEVTDVMDTHLQEGSVFIDVGANIGYETLWGSKKVGTTGKVIAFEPVPGLISQLKESVAYNKFANIEIIEKAASDRVEKIAIFLDAQDAGSSSLVNNSHSTNAIEIETVLIDTVTDRLNRVDFIKIDVEGYEPQALQGAKATIEKWRPVIVFEYQPYLYDSAYENILITLLKYGYKLYHVETTNEVEITADMAETFTKMLIEEKSLVNIKAIHRH